MEQAAKTRDSLGIRAKTMKPTIPELALVAACIALNVAVGSIIYLLKLPIYLDSIGIIATTLLAQGSRGRSFFLGTIVALLSFLFGGILVNPFLPFFVLTGIAGAAYGAFLVRGRLQISNDANWGRTARDVVFFGVGWGFLAALVSAPVVVYLFGGVTGSGSALVVAFFVKTGQQILNAAILSGFSVEPIDKTLQLLCAVLLVRATPQRFLRTLDHAG